MSVDPPTPAELERLQRVADVGRYTPYTAAERSGMAVLCACGWTREIDNNVFEITDRGRKYLKGASQ